MQAIKTLSHQTVWVPKRGLWRFWSLCILLMSLLCSVDEPEPNGGIINMGAYGGTVEASKSYKEEYFNV